MRFRHVLLLTAPLVLAACETAPQYPVRPGEPRAEMPRPTYPIREGEQSPDGTVAPPPRPAPPAPPPAASSTDGPTYYKPEPITGAAAPPDEAASPSLRGRESPGPRMPVSSAPQPALETPREVVVRPGESLFEVAERVRTPVRALIDANGLKPPYEVAPGATLQVPQPTVYAVKAGDTLFSIGRKFSIDPRSLANFNDISMDAGLKPGQRIALPASVNERSAPRPPATVASSEPAIGGKKPIGAASSASLPRTPVTPPPEPEPTSPAVATAAGKGKFIWPVKGDILSTFGPKGPGQRNDGVNIAAKEGDTVKAAAGGQVVYAGSTIPGFGNLVVIKHPDGWTSLYGNLGKISVKIRAEVSRGEEIGVAGISGPVDKPQVHFEVRYAGSPTEKARPVDPQQVLP